MPNLYDTAPAFDEPIAVIRHCHERIRKQLTTLDKLVSYLPDRGVDESVQAAAKAVLKYFNKAAPLHHQDEEVDLLPQAERQLPAAAWDRAAQTAAFVDDPLDATSRPARYEALYRALGAVGA